MCAMSNFDAHIYGPIFSATGVGESARAYWRTFMATGMRIGVIPQSHPFNEEERLLAEHFRKFIVDKPHPKLNFFRINAQEISSLSGQLLSENPKNVTNALIPMWETPKLPLV